MSKDRRGLVVFVTDYVQQRKQPDGSYLYLQSDEPVPGFSRRMMALTLLHCGRHDPDIGVGAALMPPRTQRSRKELRDQAYGRLMSLIRNQGDVPTLTVDGRLVARNGITLVPTGYFDLLHTDPDCYSGIYGPVNAKALQEAACRLLSPPSSKKESSTLEVVETSS